MTGEFQREILLGKDQYLQAGLIIVAWEGEPKWPLNSLVKAHEGVRVAELLPAEPNKHKN